MLLLPQFDCSMYSVVCQKNAYGIICVMEKSISKGWNWNIVTGSHADFWRTPSEESFYLVERWKSLGFKDFLDLGCGLGRHAMLFGKNGFNVFCFDISEAAIEATKKWAESEELEFNYQVGDMLKLPYADESFDAVLCRNVISHTDTAGMKQVASELQRVLRAGGECYLTLGSKDTWGWKETSWPKLDENTKLRQEDGPEDGVPHFYADYDLVKQIFADFDIIDVHQVEEFHENEAEDKVYESWHYHVLIRKK